MLLDSISIPDPTVSIPPLFSRIKLSQMSKLITFNCVNVPVIENVSAFMSLTYNDFPILRFPPTDKSPFIELSSATNKFEFSDASPVTKTLSFKYAIPSTVKVPWSTMFFETARLPFMDVSCETKRRAFNDASCVTNRLEFK